MVEMFLENRKVYFMWRLAYFHLSRTLIIKADKNIIVANLSIKKPQTKTYRPQYKLVYFILGAEYCYWYSCSQIVGVADKQTTL